MYGAIQIVTCVSVLVMLLAGEPMYGVDADSNCSVLTNLSYQYISTQHGNTGYQYGTVSSQHGTGTGAYSSQDGGGVVGYFSSEGERTTGNGSLPGINNVHIINKKNLC